MLGRFRLGSSAGVAIQGLKGNDQLCDSVLKPDFPAMRLTLTTRE